MHRARGFTLLELMIVIAIAAVLLTLAVPSFRSVLQNSRRADASTSLYGGLVAAHSEAIIRNQMVSVCRRSTAITSYPTCDLSAGSWVNGWVAYIDTSSTVGTTAGPSGAAAVLAVGEATDPAFVVTTNASSTLNFVQFISSGHAALPALASGTSLLFKLCNSQNSSMEGRQIEIGLSGRVALSACTNNLCSCP